MIEFLTPDRVANTIRLQRATFTGSFLLLEGSTDEKFYARFSDLLKCKLTVVSGKPSSKILVIQVLAILDRDNFQGVLGIVDADFDRLEQTPERSLNLILTDTHDLETIIIQSPALDKVLAEFGSEQKVKAFDRDIRTTLIETSLSIGYLRWVSQLDKLNLTFEDIEFKKFINDRTLKLTEIDLIKTIQNKSQNKPQYIAVKAEDLKERINSRKSNNYDPWQVCCGHDMVEVLSLGLQKAIGTYNSNEVKPELLERNLRLAYEEAYFLNTQIYTSVVAWENCNQQYKVWRSNL
jgi:Protein of unknown function (DUF4435)